MDKTIDNFDLLAPNPIKYFMYINLASDRNDMLGKFKEHEYYIADFASPCFWDTRKRNELLMVYRRIIAAVTPEFEAVPVFGTVPSSVAAENLSVYERALKTLSVRTSEGSSLIPMFCNVSLSTDRFVAQVSDEFWKTIRPEDKEGKAHVVSAFDIDLDLSVPSVMSLYSFIESRRHENGNLKTANRFIPGKLVEYIPELREVDAFDLSDDLLEGRLMAPLNSLKSAGIDHRLEWRSNIRRKDNPVISVATLRNVVVVLDWKFSACDVLSVSTNGNSDVIKIEIGEEDERK